MVMPKNPGKTSVTISMELRRTALNQDGEVRSPHTLQEQNRRFQGSGGVSRENRSYGFLPAFFDTHTGAVYLSRFANGRLAPMHLLEGLPSRLVARHAVSQQVIATKESIIAGFVRDGRFYTRQEAVQATAGLG